MSSSLQKQRRRRGKRRHTRYHKLAFRNKLGSVLEAHEEEEEEDHADSSSSHLDNASLKEAPRRGRKSERYRLVHEAKAEIVGELARCGGDGSSSLIHQNLHKLSVNYDGKNFDPRAVSKAPPSPFAVCDTRMEGTWISLSKPNFAGCLGMNEKGDYLYRLGRMSFDMFQPTELLCSIQGTFNVIKVVDANDEAAMKNLPEALKADARHGKVPVRTYNIVTAFTIEPGTPGEEGPNQGVDEPIEGTMTTYGYCLPYPTGNRFSVWFTGGSIEVGHDMDRWQNVFDKQSLPGRTLAQKSKLLFAKLLMGAETCDDMDQNGKISYQLNRPIAANIDLLYIDQVTCILRGKSGVVYVFGRVQDVEELSSSSEGEDNMEDCMMPRAPHFHPKWTDVPKTRWSSRKTTSSGLKKPDRMVSPSTAPRGLKQPTRRGSLSNTPTGPNRPMRRPSRSISPSSIPAQLGATRGCSPSSSFRSGPRLPRRINNIDDESECVCVLSKQIQGCGEGRKASGPKKPRRRSSLVFQDYDFAGPMETISSAFYKAQTDLREGSQALFPKLPRRITSCDDEPAGPRHLEKCKGAVSKQIPGQCERTRSGPRKPRRRASLCTDDDPVDLMESVQCTSAVVYQAQTNLCGEGALALAPKPPKRSVSPVSNQGACPMPPKRCISPVHDGLCEGGGVLIPPKLPRRSVSPVDDDGLRGTCVMPPKRCCSPVYYQVQHGLCEEGVEPERALSHVPEAA